MKNDTNMALIEVRNLVVAARRQLEKADELLEPVLSSYGVWRGIRAHAPAPSAPSAETLVAIQMEYVHAKSAISDSEWKTRRLMEQCQSVRDIRQHDLELGQKGKEADE